MNRREVSPMARFFGTGLIVVTVMVCALVPVVMFLSLVKLLLWLIGV